ncbi:ParB/RepB/Spo0J family partition protein [uncultured Sulfitobacter sp.]|uniref:ParB/RepB/Spo0J family partition protein n=1 Tax=uncultured Sulfitobacter sp. TaxID=191468 RepID=UPI0026106A58|nr:ParB/RepB/Spo0J family partition protein [uncultured Sulfitobacter sp.]
MTKQTKITAAEARFPLASLTLSTMNPRQNVPEQDVIELAESIWTAGLIQNLSGLATDGGGAEIVAGGRRLRALQYLAEQHPDMAETHPQLANPLVNLAPDRTTAEAWATTENIARRDLHPAEEIRAYGKMEAAGAPPAIIARAFAVTEKHVYRRLALAHLPAPVLDALQADEITLSSAAAFTIGDDEKRSLEVLEQVRGSNTSDYHIKRLLKPDTVRGSDRRAIFVGVDAYKAAGGRIGGDLFADETLFDDPDTLDALFREKLDAAAKLHKEQQGWKWVEVSAESYVGWYQIEQGKFERVYPVEGDLTEAEAERYDELAELANGNVLDDEGQAELDALQAKQDGSYTDEQKAYAGAILYIDNEGRIQGYEGLVRGADKAEAIAAGVLQKSRHTGDEDEGPKDPISQKLRDDLNRVAQGARQHAALRDPDLLIDLLAYQLSHALNWKNPLGISLTDVPNWPTTEAEGYALDERLTANPPRDMWDAKDLGASFRAFRKKGAEHVRGELVRFLAAQYRGGDEKLAAMIDRETQPSIREVWTPTAANFFSRVGGPYLNELWRDLLGLAADHPTITTFERLKKGEKAERLESLFTDEATRTALGLTDEQIARIAEWLPEGMA